MKKLLRKLIKGDERKPENTLKTPTANAATAVPPSEHQRTLPRPYMASQPTVEVSEGNSDADWAEWERWDRRQRDEIRYGEEERRRHNPQGSALQP